LFAGRNLAGPANIVAVEDSTAYTRAVLGPGFRRWRLGGLEAGHDRPIPGPLAADFEERAR